MRADMNRSLREIIRGDMQRYAEMAAPAVQIGDPGAKVAPIRR
jgi:hypothetical protein